MWEILAILKKKKRMAECLLVLGAEIDTEQNVPDPSTVKQASLLEDSWGPLTTYW